MDGCIEIRKNELPFNEAHYRGLFDKLSDAFSYRKVILDEHGRPVDLKYVFINPAFEKQFGVTTDATIGKRVTEIFPGSNEESFNWIEAVGKVAVTGQSTAFEQFLKCRGRWYRISAYSPQPGYVATISQDITDRKRTEDALMESELKYRLLFENINEVIERTTGIVSKNGGTVYNFTSDGYDAVFSGGAAAAVSCAVEIRQEILSLNEERAFRKAAKVELRIAIDAGNMMVKALVYFSKNETAGLILGATAPVVLTSRADSPRAKLLFVAAAVALSAFQKKK